MLVKDCMTRHPVMVAPATLAAEAQGIMFENKIRHLPVAGDGKRLIGLITRQRLALKSDTVGSLNVWEITRRLSNITVNEVMLKIGEVYTIEPDRTVERAACFMTDYKIGCLPVIEDNVVVGMLSEVDLLNSYQLMLGLPAEGVRVTMRMPDKQGEFAKLTSVIAKHGLGVLGIGSFPSPRHPGFYDMVLKIPRVTLVEVQKILSDVPDQKIIDIREIV